ncbi:MAG: DUF2852 domain-containing protein [Pseudomonadota bacterium]
MTTAAIRPAWTPMNIGLMIIGFILFWPLGLAMLAYIIWGDRMHEFADVARSKMKETQGRARSSNRNWSRTGNLAFDEYREAELKRLDEERRKLDEERHEFEQFVAELRRVKDKEEFDRYMAMREERRATEAADTAPKAKRKSTKTRKAA